MGFILQKRRIAKSPKNSIKGFSKLLISDLTLGYIRCGGKKEIKTKKTITINPWIGRPAVQLQSKGPGYPTSNM